MVYRSVKSLCDERIGEWAKAQGLEIVPPFALEIPPRGVNADFALNAALQLAKPLQKPPREIAAVLRDLLALADTFEDVSVAGPGFLNLKLKTNQYRQELTQLLKQGAAYGAHSAPSSGTLLIEFVSANPTGPLHVGHGRGAALGDSLARIHAHLGTQVVREFYVNDAGNQIELLGQSLKRRVEEIQTGTPFEVPENGYGGVYLQQTAREMIEAHPKLPETVEEYTHFARNRMLIEQKEDLLRFRVAFDSWFSERDLFKGRAVDQAIEILNERGYLKEEDGALWFVQPGQSDEEAKDKDRVLRRSDGRWTYFASDIAYHKNKLDRGFTQLINLWGADHHGYVARVKNALSALGADADRLNILLYQLVTLYRAGEKVQMSKRTGEFITLREVMDEVGSDACRFYFAMRSPHSALDFDLDLAKKQSVDNPVYYVQYSHARISSIERQAGTDDSPRKLSMAKLELLKEEEERALLKALALFPRTLEICARESSPHFLANYLMDLSAHFHRFYDRHRVLGVDPETTLARLALLQGTRTILAKGLELLGVGAPEKM